MEKLLYDHVSKTYSNANIPSVREISFSVAEGLLVVLLGPSGCGKTTLLKMTNRLIEPTGGTILLDGTDVRQMEPTHLRRRMGYVIQQVGLFPHMTVAQNITVVPELLKWSKARMTERVDELLELVHLPPDEFRGRYPAQLSGGQQQRVGLARALAGDPEVLLMDEPFGAIDAITRTTLQNEILDLHNKLHKTILFVTHDVDEALRLADDIAVLRLGELVQFGEPCDLLNHPADDFVRSLLGADDRIRALSLMHADTVMTRFPVGESKAVNWAAVPVTGEGVQTIPAGDNLRHALSRLLEPGVDTLVVVDGDGSPVGRLTLDDIRAATCV